MVATNNFGEVALGIHRSAFPNVGSYAHHLSGVKTIVKLVDTPYEKSEEDFIQSKGIQTKEKTQGLSQTVNEVLVKLLDTENHPVLIHCNQGKHRTGCIVGCLRRLQGWAIQDILEEYRHFAGRKARPLDEVFIQEYDPGDILSLAQEVNVANWTQSSKTRLESSS